MAKIFKSLIYTCAILFFTTGCQSTRLDKQQSAIKIAPRLAQSKIDKSHNILWGGEILKIENLDKTTELTILSYPLDRNEIPKLSKDSTGRFIAVYNGFLEPTDFSSGKLITVLGKFNGFRQGKIAAANYQFPLLSIDNYKLSTKPPKGLPFSIGIGIGVHN